MKTLIIGGKEYHTKSRSELPYSILMDMFELTNMRTLPVEQMNVFEIANKNLDVIMSVIKNNPFKDKKELSSIMTLEEQELISEEMYDVLMDGREKKQ